MIVECAVVLEVAGKYDVTKRACQMQGLTVQAFHLHLQLKIDVCEL